MDRATRRRGRNRCSEVFIRNVSGMRHSCAALLLLASGLVGQWSSWATPEVNDASAALTREELARRIDSLRPTFSAPPLDFSAASGLDAPPITLLGVDLMQNGVPLTPASCAINGQGVVKLTAYWIPRTTTRRPVDIEIRVASANPLISRTQRGAAGPVDKLEWFVGSVYKQDYEIDMSRMAQAFTGVGYITLSVAPRRGAKTPAYPLQTVSVIVTPKALKATVAPDAVQAAFGGHLRSLDTDFVLGKDAQFTVAIDAVARENVRSLAVVSAFGYGGLQQGAPVCDVVFVGAKGRSAPVTLVCGVDTARADYDAYPEKAGHSKVPVVESSETVDFNGEGRPFRRHKYATTVAVPKDIGSLESVEFRALTDRILEVYNLVLVYGDPK